MPNTRQRSKSEYGTQLAEKQKIRGEYGLREKQFRAYFTKGKEPRGVFALLEQRLDSIVFRSGLASTRPKARQMVNHGHVLVGGNKVTIPSYQVRAGAVVSIKESSKQSKLFDDYDFRMKNLEVPFWIVMDAKKKEARMKAEPDIEGQVQPFNFQMVLEFYSR